MRESIQTAVEIMRSHRQSSEGEIFQLLLDRGIDRPIAVQLVTLLPIAYGRVVLAGSGVLFSDTYLCLDEGGEPGAASRLDGVPLWTEAVAFAKHEVSSEVAGEALLAIAGRSSEVDAINKALHDGKKLQNLRCFPPLFPWPDFASSVGSGRAVKKSRWRWQLWEGQEMLPLSRGERVMARVAMAIAILVGLLAIGVVGYYAISLWRASH
jgi:hypothetical protein